jgi:hypothetical protein
VNFPADEVAHIDRHFHPSSTDAAAVFSILGRASLPCSITRRWSARRGRGISLEELSVYLRTACSAADCPEASQMRPSFRRYGRSLSHQRSGVAVASFRWPFRPFRRKSLRLPRERHALFSLSRIFLVESVYKGRAIGLCALGTGACGSGRGVDMHFHACSHYLSIAHHPVQQSASHDDRNYSRPIATRNQQADNNSRGERNDRP